MNYFGYFALSVLDGNFDVFVVLPSEFPISIESLEFEKCFFEISLGIAVLASDFTNFVFYL